MDNYDIDKKFKESLYDLKTPLDKDALWAAIEQKQPRRLGGWMIFATIAVATIILFGLWTKNTFSTQTSDDQVSHFRSKSQPGAKTHNATNTIQSKISKEVKVVSKNDKVIHSQNINISTSIHSKETQSFLQINDESIVHQKKQTSLSHSTKTEVTSTPADLDNQKYNKSDNLTKAPLANAPTKLSTLQSLSKKKTALLEIDENQINRNKNIKCYDHSNSKLELSVIGYGSADYVFNRFKVNQNQLAYSEQREASQTQLEGYRTGLQLKLLTSAGFYVKGGIELGIINERFDTEITETTTEIRPNQLLKIIEQYDNDTTIFIYGDAPFDISRTTTYEIFNTYRTIGIPFSFGYQVDARNYFYGFDIGGIYDFSYNFSGTLLDTSLQPNNDLRDYFINSNLTSLTGGLHIGYKWRDRVSLMASCSFKHNLANINNGDNTLNQSNTRVGLGVGLQYRL